MTERDGKTPPDTMRPMILDVSCAAERPLLAILRRFISSVAEEIGFEDEDRYQIEMAVDEACSNAVIHGGRQGAEPAPRPSAIELKLVIEPDALTIQIRDHGRDHTLEDIKGVGSLSEYSHPERPDYKGLGILIMKQFMDEVMFSALPETGTTVTLCKRRKARRGER